MEYLVFEKDFLDIPFQDMAGADLIVCFDPQCRIDEKTWAVVSVNSDGEYIDAKGLFWELDMAIQFAKSFNY